MNKGLPSDSNNKSGCSSYTALKIQSWTHCSSTDGSRLHRVLKGWAKRRQKAFLTSKRKKTMGSCVCVKISIFERQTWFDWIEGWLKCMCVCMRDRYVSERMHVYVNICSHLHAGTCRLQRPNLALNVASREALTRGIRPTWSQYYSDSIEIINIFLKQDVLVVWEELCG